MRLLPRADDFSMPYFDGKFFPDGAQQAQGKEQRNVMQVRHDAPPLPLPAPSPCMPALPMCGLHKQPAHPCCRWPPTYLLALRRTMKPANCLQSQCCTLQAQPQPNPALTLHPQVESAVPRKVQKEQEP
jgi:hypothetical protein